jgi:hypothetical protein
MASESDESDLRERVDQLEATVEQQQATIKKMLPGRRGALKAGGLLAGGGLLGALGSDRAAAADGTQDTSAGTIGGAGESNDIYLDQLLDPGGDEILNVDDTGDINATFGRTWDFSSVDLQNSSLSLDSLNTGQITSDSDRIERVLGTDIIPFESSFSKTFDVSGEDYDNYRLYFDVGVASPNFVTNLRCRVNGATSGYYYTTRAGTSLSSDGTDDSLLVSVLNNENGLTGYIQLSFTAQGEGAVSASLGGTESEESLVSGSFGGGNTNGIDSITVFNDGGNQRHSGSFALTGVNQY